MDTVLFPTNGNAVNVKTPDISKPDIYRRKDKVNQQPILVILDNRIKTVADLH